MLKRRLITLLIIVVAIAIAWFVYATQTSTSKYKFKLGLDLSGGTHLVYRADTSRLAAADVQDSLTALRGIIEKRVNVFGVSEPIVQTEKAGAFSGKVENRLIVELPGVTDSQKAIKMIGETPVLEFRLQTPAKVKKKVVDTSGKVDLKIGDTFGPAILTGAQLSRASLQFGQGGGSISNNPSVVLKFTSKGSQIFADFTGSHVGKNFGIFLDGKLISNPVIQEKITGGSAIISGNFTPETARALVRNLNFGALPLPITLLSSQTIGASLGAHTVSKGIQAALWGFGIVALFLILWYRLPGIIAIVSLSIYIALMLAIFKLLPVTLTAAGIAGFILSIGLAVDANVLIFERTKEELAEGKWTHNAIVDGFKRAWLSIRDSNLSSLITAVILYWLGTSLLKGFALVFGIGVLVSMFTAITVSRTFLLSLGDYEYKGIVKFLFGSGLKK